MKPLKERGMSGQDDRSSEQLKKIENQMKESSGMQGGSPTDCEC